MISFKETNIFICFQIKIITVVVFYQKAEVYYTTYTVFRFSTQENRFPGMESFQNMNSSKNIFREINLFFKL